MCKNAAILISSAIKMRNCSSTSTCSFTDFEKMCALFFFSFQFSEKIKERRKKNVNAKTCAFLKILLFKHQALSVILCIILIYVRAICSLKDRNNFFERTFYELCFHLLFIYLFSFLSITTVFLFARLINSEILTYKLAGKFWRHFNRRYIHVRIMQKIIRLKMSKQIIYKSLESLCQTVWKRNRILRMELEITFKLFSN